MIHMLTPAPLGHDPGVPGAQWLRIIHGRESAWRTRFPKNSQHTIGAKHFICMHWSVSEGQSDFFPCRPSPKAAQLRDYRGLPLATVSPAGGRAGVSENLAPSGVFNVPSGAAPSRELNRELQDGIQ